LPIKIEVIAEFKIEKAQYLNKLGEATQDFPDFAKDPVVLLELYKLMLKTRIFDGKAISLQRTGRLGTYPSVLGQEAISVAIGHAMNSDDVFCPYYRDFGAHLQRGVTMEELFLFWGGDERGSKFANNKEDLPHSIPVASQILHAAGIATAMKLRKQNRCAVTTVGDGGTSKGDFYEALNVAGVWNLPLVIVVNNNQWAISVPLSSQTSCETLAQKAISGNVYSEQVDGNDIIALRDRIGKAIEKARNGGGPTLIEAITYRLGDHTTADDASRYRSLKEVEAAKKNDPMARLRHYLRKKDFWDETQEQALISRYQQEVEQAAQNYLNLPIQPVESMFDYLYEELPEALMEQRQLAIDSQNGE
jgi:2-oxoisovalerate dehydrogenase E1 component alpha subunit